MKRILCILIFVLGFQTFYSQTDYHLVDIENDSVFDDMKLLDTIDGSYRLYFSGENHTYQTSNLKLELKLLKYFHQNHGVNTLLLEFGNVTGWLVNEYIVTGEEKLEKALKINFSKNFVNYFKEITS